MQRKHFPAPGRERFGDDGTEAARMRPDARCQGASVAALHLAQQKIAHAAGGPAAARALMRSSSCACPGAIVLDKLVIARRAAEAFVAACSREGARYRCPSA